MSKFIHALQVERTEYDDTDRDDAGQPTAQTPTTTDVMGLVQPRTANEADDYRSAGSEIADHTIFLPRGTDVRHADAILWETRRYTIKGIRMFAFGGLAHLEVDALLVTSTAPLAVGS